MTETSRKIAREANRINKVYGSRYKWTVVHSPAYFAHAYRYVYQNPVRAGICKKVEDYPWSSLNSNSVDLTDLGIYSEFIPAVGTDFKNWINVLPSKEYVLAIQKALRRAEFRFPRIGLKRPIHTWNL